MQIFRNVFYLLFGALPATAWGLMAIVFIGGAAIHAPGVNLNEVLAIAWVLASVSGTAGLWVAALMRPGQDSTPRDRITMCLLVAGIIAMAPILYRAHDGFNPGYGSIATLASMWGPVLIALHFLSVRHRNMTAGRRTSLPEARD